MKTIRHRQGSTIIEVLVSLVIVTVTALGGIALYFNSTEIQSVVLHKKMAVRLADSRMEEFREMSYSDSALAVGVTTSDIIIGGLEARATDGHGMKTTVTDPGLGYKQVQVDIDWKDSGQIGRDFNVSLVTYKVP